MITKTIVVKNSSGIHARPATLIVKEIGKFQSDILFIKDGHEVNAKSIMGIMAMAAKKGEEIEVKVDGSDEKEALKAVIDLFESNFGEE
ncbi:HPr family phosphocarrier protein [Clostridium formicaceticum]|uniref:Phosphocarrier protein HPr n=1 Tax=Clostridium formicaceticum TaxID=1497 RepID=A0AAC9RJT6_9CLOT|nr:HPr family phosphocarrier protein [Clostridium formicaceticum]AOY76573.1 phosphocarrier protein HPr [Clostridium formicaceticum]ARE86992.1 Phosphocarrier protein HPr [Clostridium formicaceticum]